jgi:hypothetical protein
MTDGHCATASEVIFVDYSSATCPGNGTSSTPFCTLPSGVTALTSLRHVLVLRGPADDKLALSTVNVAPVIVGKANGIGVASIPAGSGAAVTVVSDTVLIRDLTVAGGTTSGAKGVAVMGSGTSVVLVRVTASLGLPTAAGGMGVDAEMGTTLTMNSCTVTGNGAGGILLNTANFDIENTTITNNGPGTFMGLTTWGGILVNTPPASGPTKLNLLTVETNNQVGVSCSSDISAMVTGVLASSNAGGVQINPTCNFSSCATAGLACGAQP